MKLTSEGVRNLLEEKRKHTKDDRWIDHSISVGNSAGRIAKALEEKEHYDLFPEIKENL